MTTGVSDLEMGAPQRYVWHYKCVHCRQAFSLALGPAADAPLRPECRTAQPCQKNYRSEVHQLMLLPAPYRPKRRS